MVSGEVGGTIRDGIRDLRHLRGAIIFVRASPGFSQVHKRPCPLATALGRGTLHRGRESGPAGLPGGLTRLSFGGS